MEIQYTRVSELRPYPNNARVRGLRACGRFGMDVRAGAEIRRGQVRPGRLVVAANRPLGRVSDQSAG
jgi:hypothetical protein